MQKTDASNWLLFASLSMIWGSSFILMKSGMETLSAYQVASLRMLTASLVLLPVALKKFDQFPARRHVQMIVSGIVGSFIPAFLFCIAETKIDSSLAGFLNAFTPILTIIIGIYFFHREFEKKRWTGVLIGLLGMALLFFGRPAAENNPMSYSALVLVATILYAINLNFVHRYLHDISSLHIVAIAFLYLAVPAVVVLYLTGYFNLPLMHPELLISTGASTVLGVFGTAVGTILYYKLLKQAGAVLASLVTYGIPFVALAWGLVAGETISALELTGLAVILAGVYLANK